MVWGQWPETVALFRPAVDRYDREAGLTVAKEKAVVAVVGDEDRLVPETDAAKFGGVSVVLADAGHMLPLERPSELANLIREVAAKA
jgi:pimeloyl-ACP methyl ester carboxylesterase